MYPRTEYEMSEEDLKELLKNCRPTPCMLVGGVSIGASAQENANAAWARLGRKMGFNSETVKPIEGKGNRFFTAVPSETESQRTERKAKEAEEARLKEIADLKASIDERMARLKQIQEENNG